MSLVRNVVVTGLALAICPQHFGQTTGAKMLTENDPPVRVVLSLTSATKEMLTFDLEVINSGESPVYAATETVRTDGSQGPYVSKSSRDASTLLLEVRLFGPPPYNLYMNAARTHLILLRPGERTMEHLAISRPILCTEPPYEQTSRGREISEKDISDVQAVVGVVPATPEIKHLLDSKLEANVINGLESVMDHSAKVELYKIEMLYYSPVVPLGLKSSAQLPDALLQESGHVNPSKPQ